MPPSTINKQKHGEVSESLPLLKNGVYGVSKARTASRGRKVAVMICCLVLQLMVSGISYGLSVMYAELIRVFEAKRADAALVQSLFSGIAAGGGFIFSGPVRRYGPGRMSMVGAVIASGGVMISAFALNLETVIVSTGVIASIGMCICYLSPFIAISWIFHSDPALPLIIVTIGSSLGQFIFPYIYDICIAEYQWNGAFMVLSGVILNCVPAGIVIYCSRHYYVTGSEKDLRKAEKSKTCAFDLSLLKDVVIVLELVNFYLIAATGNVGAWFIVDIVTSRGSTRETGSLLVSLIGLANVVGRMCGALLRMKCTQMATVYHWIYLSPILALSHVLVINLYDIGALIFAVLLYGAMFGITVAQAPAIMFEASGLARYPQGMAFVNLCYGLGNFSGAYFGGSIRDLTGKYDVAFYVATAGSLYIAVSTCVIAYVMRRRHRNKQTTTVEYSKLNQ